MSHIYTWFSQLGIGSKIAIIAILISIVLPILWVTCKIVFRYCRLIMLSYFLESVSFKLIKKDPFTNGEDKFLLLQILINNKYTDRMNFVHTCNIRALEPDSRHIELVRVDKEGEGVSIKSNPQHTRKIQHIKHDEFFYDHLQLKAGSCESKYFYIKITNLPLPAKIRMSMKDKDGRECKKDIEI